MDSKVGASRNDLLDKADQLLADAGANPGDIGFQQSVIAQASDLVREAINLTKEGA